jgi:chromosome segregation ATPase
MLGKFIEKAVQKSDKLARAAVAYTKFTGFNIENVKVGQEKKISKTEDSRAKKEGKLKLHEGKLESAKLTKEKADKILKDVEAAIAMKKEELESGKPMKVKKDVDESTESIRQSTQELESLKMSEELDGLISDIDSLTQGIDAMEEDLQPIPG